MKAVSINTYYGKQENELYKFLNKSLDSTDVFCFQETNGLKIEYIIGKLFDPDDFILITSTKMTTTTSDMITTVIRRQNCTVGSTKKLLQDGSDATGNAIATYLKWGDRPFAIVNIHGAPQPGDKLDTSGRIAQSQAILDELKDYDGEVIIAGDFNLEPDTESVQMIELAGYHNLISEYSIEMTRNELAWNLYPDNKQLFADYMFISLRTKPIDFTVPFLLASDHLPMIIEL